MRDDWIPETSLNYSEYLLAMFKSREERKTDIRKRRAKRKSLSKTERLEVLNKTDGRCHICGGELGHEEWQADHVLSRSGGEIMVLKITCQHINYAIITDGTTCQRNFMKYSDLECG